MVDLNCRLWIYNIWVICGFSCVHIVHCITASELDINENYFKSSSFSYTYSHHVYPTLDEDMPTIIPSEPLINPSSHKCPPSRSHERRVDGNRGGLKKPRTCSNYNQVVSHNKTTCTIGK